MLLKVNSSIVLGFLMACFVLSAGNAFAENFDETLKASLNLKRAHILRYYERCISENRQDSVCRSELEALHPRELTALQSLLQNANKYDQLEASNAMASCYSPAHDYKDLIECWERLSIKMVAGENIRTAKDKASSPSDSINAKLAGLSSAEKISVVLCVRGAVSVNYRDTVAHNLKAGGSDATWALRVNAIENIQMSELAKAAGWMDMEAYYKAETAAIERLIQGKISIEDYKSSAKNNSLNLKLILDVEAVRQEAHKNNFQKFDSVCKDISSTVIGKAKAVASK